MLAPAETAGSPQPDLARSRLTAFAAFVIISSSVNIAVLALEFGGVVPLFGSASYVVAIFSTGLQEATALLLFLALQALAKSDKAAFSVPASLVILSLVSLPTLIGSLLFFEASLQKIQATSSASGGISSSVLTSMVGFVGIVGMVGLLELVGLIGGVLGLWRAGSKYGSSTFRAAAILYVFPFLGIIAGIFMLVTLLGSRRQGGIPPPGGPGPAPGPWVTGPAKEDHTLRNVLVIALVVLLVLPTFVAGYAFFQGLSAGLASQPGNNHATSSVMVLIANTTDGSEGILIQNASMTKWTPNPDYLITFYVKPYGGDVASMSTFVLQMSFLPTENGQTCTFTYYGGPVIAANQAVLVTCTGPQYVSGDLYQIVVIATFTDQVKVTQTQEIMAP